MRALTASHEERRQTPVPGADVGVQLFGDHGEHLCRRLGNVAKGPAVPFFPDDPGD